MAGHVMLNINIPQSPLQCPITLADTHRLKCADLSGIRLSLITISKNNFSEIHISRPTPKDSLSPIVALAFI